MDATLQNFTALLTEFLQSVRLDKGAADATVSAYKTDLTQFLQWTSKQQQQHALDFSEPTQSTNVPNNVSNVPEAITAQTLDDYLTSLARAKIQATSISRKTSALRQFFKFLTLEKHLEKNLAEDLENPKIPRKLPKHLSHEDTTRLLATTQKGLPYTSTPVETADALRARDRAMIYLLYASGLRISELLSLTHHSIDLQMTYVRVKGKGEKERIVPFAKPALTHLADYLENHREKLAQPTTEPLFVSLQGYALTRQSFWKTLKNIANQAEITEDLSPHRLRHTFATHLLQSGMNLRSLQMLLGHSDLSTTQIYAHVTPEHLKDAHEKFHPRGYRKPKN